MLMCLVQGWSLGNFNSSTAPVLLQNNLQKIFVLSSENDNPKELASSIRFMIGIAACKASEHAVYSASQVDKVISVCSLLTQMIRHPMYLMMYPVHNFTVTGSKSMVSGSKSPQKLASAYTSRPLSGSGITMIPWSWVPSRYLPIHFTTCEWDCFGSAANLAALCTAYACMGHVNFSKKFSFPMTDQYSISHCVLVHHGPWSR